MIDTKNKSNKWSFRKGWEQVPIGISKDVREKLCQALGINNRVSFRKRMNGEIIPTADQKERIEDVFRELGITKVWNDETNTRKVSRSK